MSIYQVPAKLPDPDNWLKLDLAKFSNSELLALVIGRGQDFKESIPLARQILRKIPAPCLTHVSFEELIKAGLDSGQANLILGAVSMAKNFCRQRFKNIYYSDEVIYQEFKYLRSCTSERVSIGYLDRRCHELRRKNFLLDDMKQQSFHPHLIFDPIIHLPAYQIVLASNHPSGSAEPREIDLLFFKKMKQISQAFGLEILDNVIFSRHGFYSVRRAGLIDKTIN